MADMNEQIGRELWGLVEDWRLAAEHLRQAGHIPVASNMRRCADKLDKALHRLNIPRPRVCGECGHWERYQQPGDLAKFGSCTYPLPVCLKSEAKVAQREDEDATTCPCFEERTD